MNVFFQEGIYTHAQNSNFEITHIMEEDDEERGILASIENIDVSLFRPERIGRR